jgi:hypothetical protein
MRPGCRANEDDSHSDSTGSNIAIVAEATMTATAHDTTDGLRSRVATGIRSCGGCGGGRRSHRNPAAAITANPVTARYGRRAPPLS